MRNSPEKGLNLLLAAILWKCEWRKTYYYTQDNIVPCMFAFQQLLPVCSWETRWFSVFSPVFVVTKSNVNVVSMVGGAHKRREVTFLWSLWSDEISTNAEAETWILFKFCSGLAE